MIFIAAYFEQS